MEVQQDYWRQCSACKKAIGYQVKYYECSVSTCSRKRTGYVFCSVLCWESHVPGANHRNAGAIEKRSPSLSQWQAELADVSGATGAGSGATSSPTRATPPPQNQTPPNPTLTASPRRILVSSNMSAAQSYASAVKSTMDHEVLVVVSKMKQYIKDKSDMNTAADVNEVLSDIIRRACDNAIESARVDGRKTVMARDFKSPIK